MPAFEAFLTRTAALAPGPRADAFVRDFAPVYPATYGPRSYPPEQLRRAVERYFAPAREPAAMAAYPRPSPARVADFGRLLDRGFAEQQRYFLGAFPDFRCDRAVEFAPSFGRFDGRVDDNPPTLRFGVDMIARLHTPETLPSLIHHELFHLYRTQVAGEDPATLAMALWGEGLASYVSHKLNPHLTLDQILWFPRGLPRLAESRRAEILAAMLAAIDSEDTSAFFNAGSTGNGFPPRSGYYFGYRLAEELGRTRSLWALARMPAAEVRRHAEDFLRRQAAAAAGR